MSEKDKKRLEDSAALRLEAEEAARKADAEEEAPVEVEEGDTGSLEITLKKPEEEKPEDEPEDPDKEPEDPDKEPEADPDVDPDADPEKDPE